MKAVNANSQYTLNHSTDVGSVEQEATWIKSSWIDRFSKKQIIGLLSKLNHGHLILQDEYEILNFGEPPEKTNLVAHIVVNDIEFYQHVLFGGSIGAGEAYMNNLWRSPDLVKVFRLFGANMSLLTDLDSRWSWALNFIAWLGHKNRSNSKSNARQNISAHYDLSNDFFSLFLDKSMLYSAAIFSHERASLFEASQFKMQHICERLQLSSKDHLLEIGSGWGGMAIYAAKHFGCRVTTVTLSKEQFEFANEWIERESLADRITVLLKDYRDIEGRFDKLLSIEMIEAVGWEYYPQYFKKCSQLLKQDGLMLIQAITIPDQRYDYARTHTDFIQRYIFPGGCLPSNCEIAKQTAQQTDLQIIGVEDITLDYAKTLAAWRNNFLAQRHAVEQLGFDDRFMRMWEFYLCYCEGGFLERTINTAQYLFAKPGARNLTKVVHA